MVEVRCEMAQDLRGHAMIPSTFESNSVLDVVRVGGQLELVERALAAPYRKNYDAIENPLAWPQEFDTSKWVLVSAYSGPVRIGGALGATDTPGADMLESRRDLVVLWDLRVAPEARRTSVATSLVQMLVHWAKERGCRELKVETQNTNVPACRFYSSMGMELSEANVGAYPQLRNEVQLIWRKRIDG